MRVSARTAVGLRLAERIGGRRRQREGVTTPLRGTPRLLSRGALAGTRLTLAEAQITIGRAEDSTLVINDDYASARHARLVPRGGQWYVEDLGSTNGTYLDRAKVTAPTPVPLGVPIRIGRTSIELRP